MQPEHIIRFDHWERRPRATINLKGDPCELIRKNFTGANVECQIRLHDGRILVIARRKIRQMTEGEKRKLDLKGTVWSKLPANQLPIEGE